jgi:hypothetical protein
MAGSLAHILNDDGTIRYDLVETYGDKDMALAECHQVIAELLEFLTLVRVSPGSGGMEVHDISTSNKPALLKLACTRLGFPVPTLDDAPYRPKEAIPLDDIVVPDIQPDLHGHDSVYQHDAPKDWLVWRADPVEGGWVGGPARVSPSNDITKARRFTRAEADAYVAKGGHYVVSASILAPRT